LPRAGGGAKLKICVGSEMQVKVLFFGQLKDVVGAAEDRVELPEGASVRAAVRRQTVISPDR